MGYALAILDQTHTDIEERFRSQTRAIQAGRQKSDEFGCLNQVRCLLGWIRHLWERNIALQLQVRNLTEEREEMIRRQTEDLERTLGLHNQVTELRQERDRLQHQLDDLQAEPPTVATPPSSTSNAVKEMAKSWKVLADRLNDDGIRIRKERKCLNDQVEQLQAINQQQASDLAWANFTIDVCRVQLEKLKQTTRPVSPMLQPPATPSRGQLPTHQEMGGHV